jgi:hypothetical protein
VSEEAARQIDREDMALRIAEAPQLAQGLATDAKIVGLVLPLLPPDVANATDAMGPTLAASPAHESFGLAAVAHELSWQSAMAELLSLVRIEGAAAIDSAAAKAASANAIELLLASATSEDPAGAAAAAEPQRPAERQPEHDDGFRPSMPVFVDTAFGNLGVSVLSLQNKDLFGFDAIKEASPAQTADLDGAARPVIDYDLFGSEGAQGLAGITKVNVPIVVGGIGGGDPVDGPGAASIGGIPDNGKTLAGLLKLDAGEQNITMDLKAVLGKADDTQSLVVRGDGDDHLKLVGDWVLVSENTEKSVSVYAHSDSGTTVTADHVEVVLA